MKKSTKKGSLTLEAALVLPLFLFFCMNMASLVHYFQVDSKTMSEQTEIAKNAAILCYATEHGKDASQAGSLGLPSTKNNIFHDENVDVFRLHTQKAWYSEMAYTSFVTMDRATCRKWTGYDPTKKQMAYSDKKENMVYVVDHSESYHKSKNCWHIDIRVHAVTEQEIKLSGYKTCSACKDRTGWGVYYKTDSSDIYHTSLNCTKIMRNIQTITLTEAQKRGLPPCKDCN